jgi:gliding motility-associated-like protein
MNDQYGCDVLDSIYIDSRPVNYPIGLVPSQIICEGDTFSIDATTTGWLSYLWNDGFVGPIRHLSKAGIYALEVVDAFGCSQRDSIDLYTIPPADTPDLGPDRKFCFGEVFALNLEVDSKFATINWWDGGSNSLRSVDEAGTYWVEVTDSCGNVFSDTIKISLHPQIPGDLPDSIFFCPQESMQVDITTDDITSYHWNDGVTGAIRTFNQVGTYVVIIQDINACKWSESLYIGQRPQHPAINLIPATTICEGESISLDPITPGWIHYEWRDGYIGASREFDQTGQYSLIVSDAYNCSTTAHTEVIVENCPFDIYLPNAFSPNGDGHNDWFGVPYRSNVSAYQLTIYNRWGNLLYESNDPNPGWDGYYKGGTCPEGVYVYLLNYWGLDGQFYQKRGTVTLIR